MLFSQNVNNDKKTKIYCEKVPYNKALLIHLSHMYGESHTIKLLEITK